MNLGKTLNHKPVISTTINNYSAANELLKTGTIQYQQLAICV